MPLEVLWALTRWGAINNLLLLFPLSLFCLVFVTAPFCSEATCASLWQGDFTCNGKQMVNRIKIPQGSIPNGLSTPSPIIHTVYVDVKHHERREECLATLLFW